MLIIDTVGVGKGLHGTRAEKRTQDLDPSQNQKQLLFNDLLQVILFYIITFKYNKLGCIF